ADEKLVVAEGTYKPSILAAERLLAVVDKNGALPFTPQAGGLKTQEAGVSMTGKRRPASLTAASWSPAFIQRAEDLPATPQAWQGAGAVIVNDLRLDAWEAAQAKALASWLGRGGDLVLCAGGDLNRAKLI